MEKRKPIEVYEEKHGYGNFDIDAVRLIEKENEILIQAFRNMKLYMNLDSVPFAVKVFYSEAVNEIQELRREG